MRRVTHDPFRGPGADDILDPDEEVFDLYFVYFFTGFLIGTCSLCAGPILSG